MGRRSTPSPALLATCRPDENMRSGEKIGAPTFLPERNASRVLKAKQLSDITIDAQTQLGSVCAGRSAPTQFGARELLGGTPGRREREER
jgi:hypothetical protein